jgi:hypothetical protein
MKICPIGLSVRFFKVTIDIGNVERGSLRDRTFRPDSLGTKRNTEPGSTVRNRPVANRLFRKWSEVLTIKA